MCLRHVEDVEEMRITWTKLSQTVAGKDPDDLRGIVPPLLFHVNDGEDGRNGLMSLEGPNHLGIVVRGLSGVVY